MITDLLDQIDRLDQEATKGPWTTDSTPDEFGIIWGAVEQIGGGFGERAMVTEIMEEHADAELIVLARTALPQLAKALRAVMEDCQSVENLVHKDHTYRTEYDYGMRAQARAVMEAITDALGADDD